MAMLSRGYSGQLPIVSIQVSSRQDLIYATLLPLTAVLVVLVWGVLL
jgi:hypothetical protein